MHCIQGAQVRTWGPMSQPDETMIASSYYRECKLEVVAWEWDELPTGELLNT
jgi:hypothetical protein